MDTWCLDWPHSLFFSPALFVGSRVRGSGRVMAVEPFSLLGERKPTPSDFFECLSQMRGLLLAQPAGATRLRAAYIGLPARTEGAPRHARRH